LFEKGGAVLWASLMTKRDPFIRDRWTRYQPFRRALDELSGLSDRDLTDIGIAHANIRGIAHETADRDID